MVGELARKIPLETAGFCARVLAKFWESRPQGSWFSQRSMAVRLVLTAILRFRAVSSVWTQKVKVAGSVLWQGLDNVLHRVDGLR